jgi:hypothetical protein
MCKALGLIPQHCKNEIKQFRDRTPRKKGIGREEQTGYGNWKISARLT